MPVALCQQPGADVLENTAMPARGRRSGRLRVPRVCGQGRARVSGLCELSPFFGPKTHAVTKKATNCITFADRSVALRMNPAVLAFSHLADYVTFWTEVEIFLTIIYFGCPARLPTAPGQPRRSRGCRARRRRRRRPCSAAHCHENRARRAGARRSGQAGERERETGRRNR